MEILNSQKILEIPAEDLPLMALSDDAKGFLGWGIRAHQSGFYNHFMWMIRPKHFASQDFPTFKEAPASRYLVKHRLKLWRDPSWSPIQKKRISLQIQSDLSRPWHKRLYDVPQIIGFLFFARWLQIPGSARICSDHVDYLQYAYSDWKVGRHLSPPEINRMFKESLNFRVYGRYSPDA